MLPREVKCHLPLMGSLGMEEGNVINGSVDLANDLIFCAFEMAQVRRLELVGVLPPKEFIEQEVKLKLLPKVRSPIQRPRHEIIILRVLSAFLLLVDLRTAEVDMQLLDIAVPDVHQLAAAHAALHQLLNILTSARLSHFWLVFCQLLLVVGLRHLDAKGLDVEWVVFLD